MSAKRENAVAHSQKKKEGVLQSVVRKRRVGQTRKCRCSLSEEKKEGVLQSVAREQIALLIDGARADEIKKENKTERPLLTKRENKFISLKMVCSA